MVHRIEVGLKREPGLAAKIRRILGLCVTDAHSISVYAIDADLSSQELAKLADAYSDRIVERPAIDVPWVEKNGFAFDVLIERRFRPGVTDAVGKTATEVAEAVLGRSLGDGPVVYSATQFLFSGLSQKDADAIGPAILGNPLIEEFLVLDKHVFAAGKRIPVHVPKVTDPHRPQIQAIDLTKYDETQLSVLNQS
ncbi:MAG: hypothetical protein Q8P02_01280, partial [Candidatus Micrarchaeota archaeon]|nr:hypothetical protein [Candidatus Micrarchaeota archaeon]